MKKPSKQAYVDIAITAAKAGLSLAKYGGIWTALLEYFIPNTWKRRQEEVLCEMRGDFERLEKQINKDRLCAEDFHITMVKVIRDVIVEPHKEKREAFRAILLNDAMASSPHSEKDLFIKITEDMTGDHIKLLKALSDPKNFVDSNPEVSRSWNAVMSTNRMEPDTPDMLCMALPGTPKDHLPVLLDGLRRNGLIVEGNIFGVTTLNGGFVKKTTPLGERYMTYITLPEGRQ